MLPSIIDERQTAFMEVKHMLHNMVIANEVVEEAKRCNKSFLVFKVDYEKAYDLVCWGSLLYMMTRIGFCTKWV